MWTLVEMTSATQSVLLVGASGLPGQRIGTHLLARADVRVRLLVRNAADDATRARIDPLLESGADLVDGDLRDPASLDRATRGVDVIVSAVQGGADIMVDGQVALAEAGRRNGVRRILPWDLSLDGFETTPGDHAASARRSRAAEAIAATGLEHIHIRHGGFMEMFGPGSRLLDYRRAVANYWGDGTTPFTVTSVDDTARMTARAALDRSLASGKFAFAGDRVSFAQATALVEAHTGSHFDRHCLGSEFDLRRVMNEVAETDPQNAATLASLLHMLTSQNALGDLQNQRYADIHLETLADFLVHQVPLSAHTGRPVVPGEDATPPGRCQGSDACRGPW
ncbi:MAG: NmrA family NAD(P)-binding protein [Rhizobiales bacterium]|nr:NmrA family NAD(P)-binding protein [Rhizobacter sp.]